MVIIIIIIIITPSSLFFFSLFCDFIGERLKESYDVLQK